MRAGLVSAVAAGALLVGCGGGTPPADSPAAEPAVSPAPAQPPAGEVFDVGSEPEGLVFDSVTGLLAIATRDPDRLLLMNGATGRIERRVKISSMARHLALEAPGGPVLVPAEVSDQLIRVSLPSGSQSSVHVGDFPHDAEEVAGGAIFVGDEGGDEISVVKGQKLDATLDVPEQPGGVAPAGPYVAVVSVAAHTLQIYDARKYTALGRIAAGNGPTHLVADGLRAFVIDTRGNAIEEFRVGPKPRLVMSTPLEGTPYGVAIDPRRQRLWVTLTASNEVVAFDYTTPRLKEIARFLTVRQPNTVAVDEKTGAIFIAGRTDGQIQRIASPRGV